MGLTWRATAYWLVVIDGIPHNMGTRAAAIERAREAKVPAYRQGADYPDFRISMVYDPATDTEHKANERVVWQPADLTACPQCGALFIGTEYLPTHIRNVHEGGYRP